MPSSLIRGKYVLCRSLNHQDIEVIDDGAIYQENGVIVDIGSHADLAAKYYPDQVLGSSEHIVLPGLINSHHHVGLTPLQLGSLDVPLEPWLANRIGDRAVDLYLDTLYSAFEMIESGVTTVQHLHDVLPDDPSQWHPAANQVIRAYQQIGMRVAYCFSMRVQNHAVYESNAEFVQQLPHEIASEISQLLKPREVPIQDYLDFFEQLWQSWGENQQSHVRLQLCPANLQWCSDDDFMAIQAQAKKLNVLVHMHLLETAYQKIHAHKRSGKTAVHHLDDLGFLGSHLTLAHGVWLTEADIERVAATKTRICHNASSNLRLQSGIAPLTEYLKRGVTVSMGIDEAGINDDRDMLQEMRLTLKLHRIPGIDESVPTTTQVFQMATEYGAKTTGFAREIGTLEVGKAADLVMMNWHHIAYPYLDRGVPLIDAILHRSRTSGVETVMVNGAVILNHGKFTNVDKAAVLQELAASLKVPLTANEQHRRGLAQQLVPHIKHYYEGWLNSHQPQPFYCQNSRF